MWLNTTTSRKLENFPRGAFSKLPPLFFFLKMRSIFNPPLYHNQANKVKNKEIETIIKIKQSSYVLYNTSTIRLDVHVFLIRAWSLIHCI